MQLIYKRIRSMCVFPHIVIKHQDSNALMIFVYFDEIIMCRKMLAGQMKFITKK